MATNIQKGRNLIVKIDNTIVGFAKSCDLDVTADTRDIASYKQQSGGWKEYDSDKCGWSINTEHLATVEMTDENKLFDALVAKESIEIQFAVGTWSEAGVFTQTAQKGYKGKAFITSLKLSASDGDDATFSISLQGTGVLSKITTVS